MTTFGELRSLLQHEPTAKGWALACDALDGFPDDALDDQILPYVNGAAKRWPDTLRVAPERWVRRTLEGERLVFWSVVRTIDLSYNYLSADEVLRLIDTERLDEVTVLNLDSNRIGPAGCEAIARAPGLSRLRELHLSFNAIMDSGLATLCASRPFPNLEVLDLENNALRTCDGLADSGFLSNLERLSLTRNPLTEAALTRIVSATESPAWQTLDLSRTEANDVVMRSICDRADLSLEVLDLSKTSVTGNGVAMIARWPGAASMKTLRLDGLELGGRTVRELTGSDHLGGLETLSVSKTDLGFGSLRRLIDSGALPRLRRINARGLGVTDAQWERLLDLLGPGATVAL